MNRNVDTCLRLRMNKPYRASPYSLSGAGTREAQRSHPVWEKKGGGILNNNQTYVKDQTTSTKAR